MITHDIKKPSFGYQIGQAVDRLVQLPENHRRRHGPQHMEKVAFAKWVEGTVKLVFRSGDLVTSRAYPFVPERIPSVVFVVDHVQEVSFMAPLDETYQEPKCVGVKHLMHPVPILFCPSGLRRLNDEEIKLVRLRDKEIKEREAGISRKNGDEATLSVDLESGRVIVDPIG